MSFIKSLFGGKNKQEKQNETTYQNAFLPLAQQGSAYAKEYHDLAIPTFNKASATLAGPTDYFSKILSGGHEMMNALSPELSAESTAYKNVSAGSEFAPRGAGQVSRQGQLDTAHLTNISDIVQKARPMAAQQLTGISKLLFDLGLGQGQLSLGETGTVGGLLNQFRAGNLQQYQIRQEALQAFMKTLGSTVGAFA